MNLTHCLVYTWGVRPTPLRRPPKIPKIGYLERGHGASCVFITEVLAIIKGGDV